jgi:hypothetical protein
MVIEFQEVFVQHFKTFKMNKKITKFESRRHYNKICPYTPSDFIGF